MIVPPTVKSKPLKSSDEPTETGASSSSDDASPTRRRESAVDTSCESVA